MTSLYAVDNRPLMTYEEIRHRSAVNAALCGILSAGGMKGEEQAEKDLAHDGCPTEREQLRVSAAFDHADEVIREYRRRCKGINL